MTVPFLLTLDFKKTSTWTSDDRQSFQIYRTGSVTIDDLSMALLLRKNFYTRCLSKKKILDSNVELQEIIVVAYNENNKEIGNIYLVTENLLKKHTDMTHINSINATGVFDKLNEISNGKYINSTDQVLLFFN